VGGPSKEELHAQLRSLLDQQKRLEHTLKDPNIVENEMVFENLGIQLREVEFEVAQAQARLHNFELAPSKLAPPPLSAFSPSPLIATSDTVSANAIRDLDAAVIESNEATAARLSRAEVMFTRNTCVLEQLASGSLAVDPMFGGVINRTLVPSALQHAVQVAVEKVPAILEEVTGGTRLNDIFGQAGAVRFGHSAFVKNKQVSESAEQKMVMFQAFGGGGQASKLDASVRAKLFHNFPGDALRFLDRRRHTATTAIAAIPGVANTEWFRLLRYFGDHVTLRFGLDGSKLAPPRGGSFCTTYTHTGQRLPVLALSSSPYVVALSTLVSAGVPPMQAPRPTPPLCRTT
jgi:hypothetical protein